MGIGKERRKKEGWKEGKECQSWRERMKRGGRGRKWETG